jgi:hypothetical protein
MALRRIMYRARRVSEMSSAITLIVALTLTLSATAGAQEGQSHEVHLTPSRGSGVSGIATLKDVQGGVKVTLKMNNLPQPGVRHINHIHAGGTCADDRAGRTAPVTIPLNTVVAKKDGTGSATTTIKGVTVAQLFGEDKERFILLHAKTKKGQGVPPGISCVDIPQKSGAEGVETLAATGGPQHMVVFGIPLLLILGGTIGLLALRRRTA